MAKSNSQRAHYRPKLGQHFLQDSRYRERILDALDLHARDLVIEIGPGRGAMTGLLASRARKLVAIEVDRALAGQLEDEFKNQSSVRIVTSDVLKTNLAAIRHEEGFQQAFVFGNLPYYITSPILHHLFAQREGIRAMGLLMQREVAERLTAEPGSRDYGYLTVATQTFTKPEIAVPVPPGAFSPPPKVQSALVTFEMGGILSSWPGEKCNGFLEFAKACFAKKRKNLLNNLSGKSSRAKIMKALETIGKTASARAEELAVMELTQLYDELHNAA